MKPANLDGNNLLSLNGKPGVGTENTDDFRISVAGKIRLEEVKV